MNWHLFLDVVAWNVVAWALALWFTLITIAAILVKRVSGWLALGYAVFATLCWAWIIAG